jgi:hypothetical protein
MFTEKLLRNGRCIFAHCIATALHAKVLLFLLSYFVGNHYVSTDKICLQVFEDLNFNSCCIFKPMSNISYGISPMHDCDLYKLTLTQLQWFVSSQQQAESWVYFP